MAKSIDISTLWDEQTNQLIIDVRSPGEFEKGHIPNAINIPLFTNDERAEVGTIYKQVGKEEALLKGLEFVGPKMAAIVKEVKNKCPNRKLFIHCWRGGQRSQSVAWLLTTAGFEVSVIKGGYKAYRNYILKTFTDTKLNMLVLGGRTGCGKTEILHELENQEEQLIDLEGLANHKGSAFGAIGEFDQPTVEQFENNLYEVFRNIDLKKLVWVENESKSIGRVYIPEGFWTQLKEAPLINIEIPLDRRIENLVNLYGKYPIEMMKDAFIKIKKRLGGQNLKLAIEALDKNDLHTAAAIALKYYDKSYQYMLDNNDTPNIHHLQFGKESNADIALQLVRYASDEINLASKTSNILP